MKSCKINLERLLSVLKEMQLRFSKWPKVGQEPRACAHTSDKENEWIKKGWKRIRIAANYNKFRWCNDMANTQIIHMQSPQNDNHDDVGTGNGWRKKNCRRNRSFTHFAKEKKYECAGFKCTAYAISFVRNTIKLIRSPDSRGNASQWIPFFMHKFEWIRGRLPQPIVFWKLIEKNHLQWRTMVIQWNHLENWSNLFAMYFSGYTG